MQMPSSIPADPEEKPAPFRALLIATAVLLGLSSFSFHAYYFYLFRSYDSYFPMLNEDEVVYTGQVNATRMGRADGDLFLYETRDRTNLFEKLPARVFAEAADAIGMPSVLLPVLPDLIMPAINLLIIYLLFRAFTSSRAAALFLSLSYYVLFPALFICVYTPIRQWIAGPGGFSLPDLRDFINSPNLTRFYPAQFTHLFFFLALLALIRFLNRRTWAAVVLAGVAVGFDFYVRVYDAIVLSILAALLAGFYLIRKDFPTVTKLAGLIGVLTLTATPYLLDHRRLGASPYYLQYLERVVIDIGTREILYGRLALFLMFTGIVAGLFYLVLRRTRPKGPDPAHHLFLLLLPASWMPYFLNVILGYNINRSHWLWYHILPIATSICLFSLVEFVRHRLPKPAFRKAAGAGLAALLLFHFTYSFVPYARRAESFRIPEGLRETFRYIQARTKPEEVLCTTLFPFVQITYTDNWSFLPYSAYSTATNDELMRRYLLFKKFYYGDAFTPRIYELLRQPFDPRLHADLATHHFHFDFPERSNEFTQLRYVYDAGFEIKPHLARLIPYHLDYEPAFVESIPRMSSPVYRLSIRARRDLEGVNAMPNHPEEILRAIHSEYRLNYVLFRPLDIERMPPGWWDKIRTSKGIDLIFSKDGYHLFRVAPARS